MPASLTVDALEAFDGDAILVSCRSEDTTFTMLVDGGRAATEPVLRERLLKLERLDLLVVTHIDGDHIEGIVALLEGGLPTSVGEIWFNGLPHIAGETVVPGFADLAVADGIRLTEAIRRSGIPWNSSFDHAAACVERAGDVATRAFGEVTLTLISPDRGRLRALANGRRGWRPPPDDEDPGGPFRSLGPSDAPDAPDVATLARQRDRNDSSGPNGSSIAFLVEFRRWRVLLCADAHPRLLSAGLRTLGASRERPLTLDVVKVSHHGSRENTTRELLELIDCGTYILSGRASGRPHDETIAKIVMRDRRVDLVFNYAGACFDRWDDEALRRDHGFDIRLQPPGGVVLSEPDTNV